MDKPILLIVAGPNGAGKSTFIENMMKIGKDIYYICPDIIASELRKGGIHKDEYGIYQEAMKIAEKLRYEKLREKKNLIVETVFSSNEKLEFMKNAKEYDINLVFIGTDSVEINASRISKRVSIGGHSVPIEKIKPRYLKSIENLILAFKENLCHKLFIIDNSSDSNPYKPYFCFENKNLIWVNKELSIQNTKIQKLYDNVPDWVLIIGEALIELSNNICLDENLSFSLTNNSPFTT